MRREFFPVMHCGMRRGCDVIEGDWGQGQGRGGAGISGSTICFLSW